ncbi:MULTISPECIES: ArsR/SmtB family transcription factor [unclassified Ornithinimicrobium]|uniref:ArsR/SmtB family transcription factor n=1 Tax=unclassified Ornithinimicrobium TaxID=2615080 RepID=UPI003853777F
MTNLATPHTHAVEDVCCPGADCELLPREQADELADVFKALADPTRVRLLQYLAESQSGTACACHLPTALGVSQPTLSFHMRKLHDAGLVTREKRGRWVHYSIRPESLARVRGFLALPAHRSGDLCC